MSNIDLSDVKIRKAIATEIEDNVNEYCRIEYNDGHRNHLGASIIGRECTRQLWYIFRWVKEAEFDGRMQRLFNRGHKEEARFIEWLEAIGCEVWSDDLTNNVLWYHPESSSYVIEPLDCKDVSIELVDVSNDKIHINCAKLQGVKFPQYRVSGVNGHFGGSLDLIIKLPPRFGYDKPILGECKTHNTGAGFNNLRKNGMENEKYEHFCQTSTYGDKTGFEYCLYGCINKNDDDLIFDLVKLNHNLGQQMEMKAGKIIYSQTPPPKLSNDPSYYKCKFCTFNAICHKGALVEKNCRSCKNAEPVDGGEWACTEYNNTIPEDFIKVGCEDGYQPITSG